MLRTAVGELREIGRATQGVRLIRVDEGDRVVAVGRVVREDNGEKDEAGPAAAEGEAKKPDAPADGANGADAGNGQAAGPDAAADDETSREQAE
jgi:DNA gyrase subunit A